MVKLDVDEVKEDSDVVVVDESRSTAATKVDANGEVVVKLEPGTVDPSLPSSPPLPVFKPPTIELNSIDNLGKIEDASADKVSVDDKLPKPEPPSSPIAQKSKPRLHSRKDKKPVIQTAEDRAEYERHLEDVRVLQQELGNLYTSSKALPPDEDGNVVMGDSSQDEKDHKSGRLYLFQFPPVLPKLYNPSTQDKPLPPGQVAADIKEEGDGDVEMIGSGSVDLRKGTQVVKDDKKETILKEDDARPTNLKSAKEKFVDEEGFIGKLVVRESGRVELDWGGTRMLVGRGIPTSFLTTGVLLDPPDHESRDGRPSSPGGGDGSGGAFGGSGRFEPVREGKATGMGTIMGKFVVTPDWESML